jgi:hypothetical protein
LLQRTPLVTNYSLQTIGSGYLHHKNTRMGRSLCHTSFGPPQAQKRSAVLLLMVFLNKADLGGSGPPNCKALALYALHTDINGQINMPAPRVPLSPHVGRGSNSATRACLPALSSPNACRIEGASGLGPPRYQECCGRGFGHQTGQAHSVCLKFSDKLDVW